MCKLKKKKKKKKKEKKAKYVFEQRVKMNRKKNITFQTFAHGIWQICKYICINTSYVFVIFVLL